MPFDRQIIFKKKLWLAGLVSLLLCPAQVVQEAHAAPKSAQKLSPAEFNKATFVYNKLNSIDTLIKAGKNVEARQLLERLITYDPNPYSGEVHGLLAQSCYDLGNDKEAIEHYQIALKHNPKDPCAHWNIALATMHLGDYDGAAAWAKKLLALDTQPALRQQAERFITDMAEKKAEVGQTSANSGSDLDYLATLQTASDAHRWPLEKMPLRIFIEDGSKISNYRPQFRQIFLNGLDTWMKASQNRLSYTLVDNASQADMLVVFTANPADIAQKPGMTPVEQGIARTKMVLDASGVAVIDKVLIQILVVRPASGKPCSDDAIKETCLHELGHALGLNGHSPNASDIMHFVQSFRQLPALTRRDKNTIARLYSSYPSVTEQARSDYSQQNYSDSDFKETK
jgi:predicted Zn-dependent protease